MKKKAAFSLIELITVVAIIIILFSLLITGINGARSKALRMSCAKNIHSIIQAMVLYVNEDYAYTMIAGKEVTIPAQGSCLASDGKIYVNHIFGALYNSKLTGNITSLSTYVCPENPHTPPIARGYKLPFKTNYITTNGHTDYTDYAIIRRTGTTDTIPDLKADPKSNAIIWESDDWGLNHKTGRNIGFLNGSVKFIPSDVETDYPYNTDYTGKVDSKSILARIHDVDGWTNNIIGMNDSC